MPVDLHLISWNRPKMTELVIRTISRNTKPGTFKLTVLDNGSDGETPAMLERLRDEGLIHDLILLKTNLGLEAARQLLFRECVSGDYFVCIDNDCLSPVSASNRDWLDGMLRLMEWFPDYAAISMRTQVMIGTGNIFEEADEHDDDIVEFPHPGGSFRIMRTKWVNLVGGWDRDASGRGAEERYIGSKLNESGFKTGFAAKIQCLHLFGTRGGNPTDRWGYDKSLRPEDTGHSDVSHPALTNGDDKQEILKYASSEDTEKYLC